MTYSRAHILVKGYVQGVGYRFFAQDRAQELNLCGYAKNISGGNVEIEVEGFREKIGDFIRLLKEGPSAAHITDLVVSWSKYSEEFEGFNIRY